MTTKEKIVTSVKFGEPPVNSSDIMKNVPTLLQENPGSWAIVRSGLTQASSQRTASRIRRGNYPLFPNEEFEAIARRAAKGDTWDLWMRYIA